MQHIVNIASRAMQEYSSFRQCRAGERLRQLSVAATRSSRNRLASQKFCFAIGPCKRHFTGLFVCSTAMQKGSAKHSHRTLGMEGLLKGEIPYNPRLLMTLQNLPCAGASQPYCTMAWRLVQES